MTCYCFVFSFCEIGFCSALIALEEPYLYQPFILAKLSHDLIPRISEIAAVSLGDRSAPLSILFRYGGSERRPVFLLTSSRSHLCVWSISISFFFTSFPKSVISFHPFDVDKYKIL